MSDFEQLLDVKYDEATSTKMPLPPADDYNGIIGKIEGREVQTKDGPRNIMRLPIKLDGFDGFPVNHDLWLDMNEAGDGMDMSEGKNLKLGQVRKALGQNEKGVPWSPRMLEGQPIRVRIDHRPDKNDPEIVYAEVKRVGAVGQEL